MIRPMLDEIIDIAVKKVEEDRIQKNKEEIERAEAEERARRNKGFEDAMAFGLFGGTMSILLNQMTQLYLSKISNNLPLFNDLEEFAVEGGLTLGLAAGTVYGAYKFGRYAWSWLCEKMPLTGKTRDEYLREQYPDAQFLIDARYHEF